MLIRLLPCTANRHAVELGGGHTDTDRDGLSGLAACADAFIEGEIVAHHGDIFESFGAATDEGCSLDRTGDLAVLDEVGLGGGEDELSVCDVHLAAAEVDGIKAALDRLDDVFGLVRA